MKIAISTTGGGLQDNVCQFFGRCPTFTLVETNGGKITGVTVAENPGNRAGGGAGIAAAQAVIDSGAEAVITGNCGPKALAALSQSGIGIYESSENVEIAVKKFLEGKLRPASPIAGYQGMGSGSGMGRGRGFGGGRA